MSIDLDAIKQLTNPHLLIVGDAANARLALLGTITKLSNAMVFVGTMPLIDGGEGTRLSIANLDLLGAMTARREGTLFLREMIISMAGDKAQQSAALIFEEVLSGNGGTSLVSGQRIPVRFPKGISVGEAKGILADMDEWAGRRGLPEPIVHVRLRGIAARAAIVELEARRIQSDDCLVMMPFETENDLRPYAVAGMLPELDDAQRQSAVAIKVAEYRAEGIFKDASDEEITEIASRHLGDVLWRIAVLRAVRATTARTVASRDIIDRLKEKPATAEVGAKLAGFLSGGRALPTIWQLGMFHLFDTSSSSDARIGAFIRLIFDEASEMEVIGQHKFLIFDASSLPVSSTVEEALIRVLRIGRKHNLHLIVVAECQEQIKPIIGWFGNKITTWENRHIIAGWKDPLASDTEVEHYGIAEIGGTTPVTIEQWYERSEVADGHHILSSGHIKEPIAD